LGECHKIFTDKISGKSRAKRQALADLLEYIRDDDTVRIASMDRLGRDTRDLYNIVAEITDKGAAVEFVNENITVDKNGASPMDSLMLGILAAFAEFERRRIKERQAEGIALAKAKGKYAQQPALSDDDIEQVKALVELGHPKTEIARQFQVSRQTIYNALNRHAASKYITQIKLTRTKTLSDQSPLALDSRAIEQTRKLLEAAGADVVEIDLGWSSAHIRDITMGHFGHLLAGSMSEVLDQYDWQAAYYTRQFLKVSQRAAKKMTLWETLSAEHQIQHDLAAQLADVEVLIAPVSAVSALHAEASYLDGLSFENAQGQTVRLDHYWQAHMTVPFNINNRCPVLALPAPETGSPIPVGLQIIGKAHDENTVFNAGYAFEQLSPFPGLAPEA